MAHYLPADLINKLTTFDVSITSNSIPTGEVDYPTITNILNLFNIFLKIKLYSVSIRYNFLLNPTKIGELLELRELINTRSTDGKIVTLQSAQDRYLVELFYRNRKLRIEETILTNEDEYVPATKIRVPEQMLAVVDALIDYIEYGKKQVTSYNAWLVKRGLTPIVIPF